MRGERIAAPIFALLIVFSGAGGAIAPGASPVGTAEAQLGDGSGGACDSADWFLTFVSGTLLTTDCKTAGDVSEEWNETDAKQTRTQIHSQAGQLAAGNEQFLTAMSNSVTDSDTIAFSKGEAAAVETLANGGTVAEAQAAANESIEDYYAVKRANLIDRYSVNVQTIATLNQRAENTTGVNTSFISPRLDHTVAPHEYQDGNDDIYAEIRGAGNTKMVSLGNGSTLQSETLHLWGEEQVGSGPSNWESVPKNATITDISSNGTVNMNAGGYGYMLVPVTEIGVEATENLSSKTPLDFSEFRELWVEINQREQQTKEEVAVYIEESLAPAVESGDLNATSYVSPATLAQEYAQEYGNDSSYIRATAIATYAGMDTPDLENTGSMTITHDGTTYKGLLLSQEAPSGGWQSGETYDPALLSGLQMFAVAGENSSIVELDGAFTVDKVTGTDGQEIDKATTINVTYETSNASANYSELQQQIRSLNKQIEERQAQATTGGSDVQTNDGLLAKIAAALGVGTGVVLVGAAAVVVVAARFYLPDQ